MSLVHEFKEICFRFKMLENRDLNIHMYNGGGGGGIKPPSHKKKYIEPVY